MDFTLQPHPTISKPEGPLLVCVLDGFGETQLLPMLACWTHRRVLSSLVRAPPCPHAAALRPPCSRATASLRHMIAWLPLVEFAFSVAAALQTLHSCACCATSQEASAKSRRRRIPRPRR